jgi:Protein of unknown function (DUF1236)
LKNTLMITTSVAALVVAGGLAFAQDMNEHREQPAAAAPEQKAPEGKTDRQNLSAPQKSGSVKPAPSAQLPQKPTGAEAVGQGRRSQPSQHNAQTQSERTAPDAAAQAPAALSTEHHAQIRETIRSENVAPLTDVHFSVTIGEAVPRTVHLNRLSPRIIEYAPEYRGYAYILVGDDILIVDPRTLRIVAVIPA